MSGVLAFRRVENDSVAPVRAARGGHVRAFERGDIAEVCRLFASTFLGKRPVAGDALAAGLEDAYFSAPSQAAERGSIVHVNAAGRINGFLGIINLTLRLGHRRLSAGIVGAYMSDRDEANPLIGARLARAAVARGLDVLISDTANRTSLEISRALGFTVMPLQSLRWTKILRPAAAALQFAAGKGYRHLWTLAAPAALIDHLLRRIGLLAVNAEGLRGSQDLPLDVADFVAAAPEFVGGYALAPDWDTGELSWVLAQAALRSGQGPLHVRQVIDRGGRRLGLYLMYAGAGGIARVIQILARPGQEKFVVGHLLRTASRLGAVAVQGRATREAVSGLMWQSGVYYRHAMGTIIWTADAEVAEAIRGGNVFLGGLVGETWTRVFAD
jgi:hypothetical protein